MSNSLAHNVSDQLMRYYGDRARRSAVLVTPHGQTHQLAAHRISIGAKTVTLFDRAGATVMVTREGDAEEVTQSQTNSRLIRAAQGFFGPAEGLRA